MAARLTRAVGGRAPAGGALAASRNCQEAPSWSGEDLSRLPVRDGWTGWAGAAAGTGARAGTSQGARVGAASRGFAHASAPSRSGHNDDVPASDETITVTFIEKDGTNTTLQAPLGLSMLEAGPGQSFPRCVLVMRRCIRAHPPRPPPYPGHSSPRLTACSSKRFTLTKLNFYSTRRILLLGLANRDCVLARRF
jgi:hypothetical protein